MKFEMRGIRKAFGATQALDGVELSVAPGEICGLVGQNGAGKSTLMAVLSGALQPDAGSMTIDGHPYAPRSPIEARRAGVAMIYQELSLAPDLTVMENLLLGAEPVRRGLSTGRRCARGRRRARASDTTTSPTPSSATPPVAQQQPRRIARALAIGCRVPCSTNRRAPGRAIERPFAGGRLKAQGHATSIRIIGK